MVCCHLLTLMVSILYSATHPGRLKLKISSVRPSREGMVHYSLGCRFYSSLPTHDSLSCVTVHHFVFYSATHPNLLKYKVPSIRPSGEGMVHYSLGCRFYSSLPTHDSLSCVTVHHFVCYSATHPNLLKHIVPSIRPSR